MWTFNDFPGNTLYTQLQVKKKKQNTTLGTPFYFSQAQNLKTVILHLTTTMNEFFFMAKKYEQQYMGNELYFPEQA